MKTLTKSETADRKLRAMDTLRRWIKPGDTIYTTVTHVAKSGMYRTVRLFKILDGYDGAHPEIADITGLACAVGVGTYSEKHSAMGLAGCGYSIPFEAVYCLGRVLWPTGDGVTVTRRNGDTAPEKDGGYLLKQRGL